MLPVNALLKRAVLEEMEGVDSMDIVSDSGSGRSGSGSGSGADGGPPAPSARLFANDKNACSAALKVFGICFFLLLLVFFLLPFVMDTIVLMSAFFCVSDFMLSRHDVV